MTRGAALCRRCSGEPREGSAVTWLKAGGWWRRGKGNEKKSCLVPGGFRKWFLSYFLHLSYVSLGMRTVSQWTEETLGGGKV